MLLLMLNFLFTVNTRSAILGLGLGCSSKIDDAKWPEKIMETWKNKILCQQ